MRFVKKLDNGGLAHYFVPLVVMVLTGVAGAYMLVASHAFSGQGGTDTNAYQGPVGTRCKTGYSGPYTIGQNRVECRRMVTAGSSNGTSNAIRSTASKIKTCTTGAITASGQCVKPTTTTTQAESASADVPDTIPASSSNEPAPTASHIAYSTVKHTDPRGDIIVVSYVHVPGQPDNHRLGGLGVKITRQGGGADCLTHSSGKSSTSQQKDRKGHSKTHGLVHFLNCKAGDYTITALDRPGYITLGEKTKTRHLSGDEKQLVKFTMQKANTGGAAAN